MARINLLPWRDELRAKRKRDFLVLLVLSALAMALVMVGVHMFIGHMIEEQGQRNGYLRQEITAVDRLIKEIEQIEQTKEKLLARMDIIQQLQTSRPEIVHLFDELVETIPEGVVLSKVTQSGPRLQLTGRAESNARVSSYMRNIEDSRWIGEPDLKLIQSKDKDKAQEGLRDFDLIAKQVSAASGEAQ